MKPQDLYAQLELITPEFAPATDQPSGIHPFLEKSKTYLRQMGHSLVNALCGSREPQILTKRDRQGNPYFVAYDPVDQARYTFTSEADVRTWLDQRYYQ